MKVLFQSYNTCCQNETGGVQNRLRTIRDYLIQRGVQVDLFNPFESKLKEYDILHVFMLNYESLDLMYFAKNLGKKIVLSSIVNIKGGAKIHFHQRILKHFPFLTTYNMMGQSLNLADKIITETDAESSFIQKHYGIDSNKFETIPNGITVGKYTGNDIYDVIGKKTDYIIQIGRFDKNKNQLNVIKALKDTGIHVVFMGGPSLQDPSYYSKCKTLADGDSHFIFLGWVEHDSNLFLSAVYHAKALVMPSFYETFGLVALEAAVMGCNLALSDTLPILSYDALKGCTSFKPDSLSGIRNAVLKVMSQDNGHDLQDRVTSEFSWSNVIDRHIDLYKSIL